MSVPAQSLQEPARLLTGHRKPKDGLSDAHSFEPLSSAILLSLTRPFLPPPLGATRHPESV